MYEQLKLDNQLCFRFYTVSRLITQAYRPMLSRLGVTYPQYLVLMVLWEQDCQPVNDIAKRLYLETNTVTPLLKRMEEMGIVSRRRGEADTRQVIVSLTEKGKAMEPEASGIPFEMACAITCNELAPAEFENLAATLDSLIDTLSAETVSE